MEPLDVTMVQAQLVRCQEILDASRQEGWSPELVNAFYDATRALHEGAVVRHALEAHAAPTPTDDSGTALEEKAGEEHSREDERLEEIKRRTTSIRLLREYGHVDLVRGERVEKLWVVRDSIQLVPVAIRVDRKQLLSVRRESNLRYDGVVRWSVWVGEGP